MHLSSVRTQKVNSNKSAKAPDSRKSLSWWRESHIAPRNTKWLTENLDEMDQHYKSMLKLIEGNGDSLTKKAEMYFERRPQLLSHAEELYRMYKLLAERYEHMTVEIKKNLLPDLQSQVSVGSETSLEVTSVFSSPELKVSHRRSSGQRAAGFDFFLGSGKSGLDRHAKGDETSISDSETESDVSSLYSYPGISGNSAVDSEADLHNDYKLQLHEQEIDIGSLRRIKSENLDFVSKMIDYEEELRMAREKIRLSEEEITNLKTGLQKFASLESTSTFQYDLRDIEDGAEAEILVDVSEPEEKVRTLVEELRIAKNRLNALDKEAIQLRKENKESSESLRKMQDLLKLSQQDAGTFKRKLESEKRQVSKLQDRIARYKASLTDREIEVRELKETISDSTLKYQLHAEISRLTDENTSLEEKLRELEMCNHTLETQHEILGKKLNDEINHLREDVAEKTEMLEALKLDLDEYKHKYDNVMSEKDELHLEISARNGQIGQLEKHLQQLVTKNVKVFKEVEELREEVERQKALITEGAEGKREAIRQLCFSLEHYRDGYEQLRQAFMGHKQHRVLAS